MIQLRKAPLTAAYSAIKISLKSPCPTLNFSQLHSKPLLEFQPWFSLKIQQIIIWISVMIFIKILATIHLNFHIIQPPYLPNVAIKINHAVYPHPNHRNNTQKWRKKMKNYMIMKNNSESIAIILECALPLMDFKFWPHGFHVQRKKNTNKK